MAGWNMKTVQERIEARAEENAKQRASREVYHAIPKFSTIDIVLTPYRQSGFKDDGKGNKILTMSRSDILDLIYAEAVDMYTREEIDSISAGVIESFDRIQELTQAVEEIKRD